MFFTTRNTGMQFGSLPNDYAARFALRGAISGDGPQFRFAGFVFRCRRVRKPFDDADPCVISATPREQSREVVWRDTLVAMFPVHTLTDETPQIISHRLCIPGMMRGTWNNRKEFHMRDFD